MWFGGQFEGPTFTFGFANQYINVSNPSTAGSTAQGFIGLYNAQNLSVLSVVNIGSEDGGETITALDVDGTDTIPGDGSVYFLGEFTSLEVTLGTITVTNTDTGGSFSDFYVGKMNRDLTPVWFFSFGHATGFERATALAVSRAGNAIYITGAFNGPSITFDSTTLANNGSGGTGDAFVAKLDASNGAVMWVTQFFGEGDDFTRSLVVDGTTTPESVLVCGTTDSNIVTMGSLVVNRNAAIDGYLTRLDGDTGTVLNATIFGGNYDDNAFSVEVHETTGNIYLSGTTTSTGMQFAGQTTSRTAPSAALFVAKYGSDLSEQWLYTYSATGDDNSYSSSLDQTSETLYVTSAARLPEPATIQPNALPSLP